MKILIISSYDGGYKTNVAVLENEKYINYEKYIQELLIPIGNEISSYTVYDDVQLKEDTKTFLKAFDYILLCEDGTIEFYKVEDLDKPNKGRIL